MGWLDQVGQPAEVLLVDDGSTDQTAAQSLAWAKQDPRVRAVSYKKNAGKGRAVRIGVAAAKGDWLLLMDADNATPISEFALLWERRRQADIIIGSRYLGRRQPGRSWLRQLVSRFGNGLVRLLLLPGLSDTQCGFKLFSAESAKRAFSQAQVDRWGFDFEVLAIARRLNYRIIEVPVAWQDAAGSHLRAGRAAWSTLKELVAVWWRLRQMPLGKVL